LARIVGPDDANGSEFSFGMAQKADLAHGENLLEIHN
jgi:hypothetical protein